MRRTDWIGAASAIAALSLLIAYRHWFIEPRAWGAICAAAPAPWQCAPRSALLWMQMNDVWGLGGLGLGLWAFMGGPLAIAVSAVTFGAAGVINFNATYGLVGAALGGWAWLRREHATRRAVSP